MVYVVRSSRLRRGGDRVDLWTLHAAVRVLVQEAGRGTGRSISDVIMSQLSVDERAAIEDLERQLFDAGGDIELLIPDEPAPWAIHRAAS